MIKFVLITVDFKGNVSHCVHNPTYQFLHNANLVIVPNENGGLRATCAHASGAREVTPDEALELVEKYIKFGQRV